ncbi:N-acetyl-gamma-glutamyl-phosphate reductase [Streptomyces violens]|uniref:N-acetyl-gamma-glutamyl-phosphate reductase n=1 Tax=Streptomyces violens TaxID=66377 RepID=UPI0004BF9EAA|nr:N-acetyl-gamma-glutamyl-phosphate reductase [Streptomyces violens]
MKTSVLGAAGYTGGELLRLVHAHPELELAQAVSRRYAGRPVAEVHPNLQHLGLTFRSPQELDRVDTVFLALPAGASAEVEAEVAERAGTVVDLSPDFRAGARSASGSPYRTGLPELFADELAGAERISVPGCTATAAVLALAPVQRAGLVAGDVVVDARASSSGSGAEPTASSHHAERGHAFRVYRPAGHRHEAEIAQLAGVRARMTVTAVPAVRGLQVICHVTPPEPVTRRDVLRVLQRAYRDSPFVRVIARGRGVHRMPDPQFLGGTNFTDIGCAVDEDGRRIVLVAALDNLVKGAAGGGVQSLNVARGLPEDAGLDFPGLHPA